MNKKIKNILKFVVPIIIVYLIISSIYIFAHIGIGTAQSLECKEINRVTNVLRVFMGLPSTQSAYMGVGQTYLIQVAIKIVIAVVLLIFYPKVSEKNNRKWTIVAILVLIVTTLCIGVKVIKNNIQVDGEVEGKYTGYQLILRADYGGYGIAGQDLSSGTIIKVYNVNDNDTFFEDIFGGIWELNIENTSEKGSTILKINQIGEEKIEIEYNDKKYTAKYGEIINIPSNISVEDGINYYYTIQFCKYK